jgi:hypothetical protein
MRPQSRQRALFIGADQTRVTRDIRGENGGEPTLHGNPASERTGRQAILCRDKYMGFLSPIGMFMVGMR